MKIARSFLGELLKYVVNARLPIERLKQSITSLSRSVGIETCCGGIQRGLGFRGGRLPGIRHHSNLEPAKGTEMIARIAVLLFALSAGGADAHDYWSDGKAIPDWVKASCCGPADAHHLRPEQVHRISDEYYSVDGYVRRIPVVQALPSQDGDYWIFYRDDGANGQSGIYCFFVPMAF